MTHNPINAFKITLYNTKNTPKIHNPLPKIQNVRKQKLCFSICLFFLYQISVIHILYIRVFSNLYIYNFHKVHTHIGGPPRNVNAAERR